MKKIIMESQNSKAVDAFITYCLEPHEVKTIKTYPNSIFWIKEGMVVVEIENSKDFFLDYEIWKNISKMFDFNTYENKSVISMWLEKHYNLGELALGIPGTSRLTRWDVINLTLTIKISDFF